MCGLKTIALAALVGLSTAPAISESRLDYVFAGCVGRYSAEMEHAWLMSDASADRLEERRHIFVSLMEATMPTEAARDVLRHRIDNKQAHASLLAIAAFGQDKRQARAARSAARAHILRCERLLLDS